MSHKMIHSCITALVCAIRHCTENMRFIFVISRTFYTGKLCKNQISYVSWQISFLSKLPMWQIHCRKFATIKFNSCLAMLTRLYSRWMQEKFSTMISHISYINTKGIISTVMYTFGHMELNCNCLYNTRNMLNTLTNCSKSARLMQFLLH